MKKEMHEKRQEREDALNESRRLLDYTQKLAKIGGWEWDIERQTMSWTDETYRIHGMKPGDLPAGSPEFINRSLACYDPADRPLIEIAFRRCVKEAVPYDLELPFTQFGGKRIWIRTMANALKKNGRIVKVIGNIMDITDRKQAEISLHREKVWSENIINSAPNIVVALGEASRINVFNHYAERLTGYKAEEVVGKKWIEIFIPEESREKIYQVWDDIVDNQLIEHRFENFILTKTGERRLIEWNNTILTEKGEFRMILSMGVDITERKQAEEALRKSEATIRKKLNAILEPDGDIEVLDLSDIIDTDELQSMMEHFYKITQIGGAILDVSGKVLVGVGWSDICAKFHRACPQTAKNCMESDLYLANGVAAGTFKAYRCKNNMWDMASPIEIGGKHLGNIYIGQFFYEDEHIDYELFKKQARQYGFDETEYIGALERVPRLKREMVDSAMVFYAKLAEMISSLSYSKIRLSRDIAQRKQAEQELIKAKEEAEKNEKNYRMLFNSNKDSISLFGIGTDGKPTGFIEFNHAACELFGYTREELMLKKLEELERPVPESVMLQRLKTIQTKGSVEFETIIRDKAGNDRHTEVKVILINYQNQPVLMNITRDITQRKCAEKELILAKEKAEESEKRFRTAREAMLDSFLIFSAERNEQGEIIDFIFKDMNTSAEKMLQKSLKQLIGKRMCEELPINRTNGFFEKYKNVLETGIHLEEEFWLPDTHVPAAWYYHQVVKCDDGIAISHRDITERKQAEKELVLAKEKAEKNEAKISQYKENLEELVRERTHELEEKNQELEHFNKLFIGREIRIKELKDEIRELHARLSQSDRAAE